MKIKMNRIFLTLLGMTLVVMTACNDGKKEEERAKAEAEKMELEMQAEKEEIMAKEKAEAEEKRMAMESSIAGKAMATADLSTLVTALQSADLASMLSEPGEYTVFAPSNHAFSKLPQGTVENLLKPENKDGLQSVLQYHVVAGKISPEELANTIKGASGNYTFNTVHGEPLTASMSGDQYVITDASGKKAQVIQGGIDASNGVVYVIDTVLMSKK